MEEQQDQPIAEAAEPVPPKRSGGDDGPVRPTPPKRRIWGRLGLGIGALLLSIIAGAFVTFFTVDLGPTVKRLAEERGSKAIQRPMHIGRLSARLTPGVFEVDDLVIEGLAPTDRPFLKAKKIVVSFPWWSIFTRKLVVEWIEMSDWDMVIESFANGKHNFPKFPSPSKEPKKPGRFTTTVRSVLANRGRFTYVDHAAPWSIEARDLRVHFYRAFNDYQGDASFGSSTIRIQAYEPFSARMRTHYRLDGSMIRLTGIDLQSDGASTTLDGEIDMSRWPEQIYRIKSKIDFSTQKNIFFHGQNFSASGVGDFGGTFHIIKGAGFELKGTFASPMAGVKLGGNNWSFPNLNGSVLWVPRRLEITNTRSGLYGGSAFFDYRLISSAVPGQPTRATWDVSYRDVDLVRLTDFLQTEGIRLAGRISGRNRLEWALGKWGEKRGDGEITSEAPTGVAPMTREFDPELVKQQYALGPEAGPFNSHKSIGYVPVAGHISYRFDPRQITLGESWTATPKTYVEFSGSTAYLADSHIPFHVTSLDWQESDRVLAGIMTAFGAPTGAVEIGGHGQFDGVMTKSFSKPRIEGVFSGEHMRAWDVDWGTGRAGVAIENGYVDVSESSIRSGGSEINATGRFSLGYPRKDQGEEINAFVTISRRPLAELRHAFLLDDWPVNGLLSGVYRLTGHYETPKSPPGQDGTLLIEDGVAYGEPFERTTARLEFTGTGVFVHALDMTKSTGSIKGSAEIKWDGHYAFDVTGDRIPIESLKTAQFPALPLSGLLHFKAEGNATFENPSYNVVMGVDDLFAADEGIGAVQLGVHLRGQELNLELNAASPRLLVTGSGRIALTEAMDANLSLQFQKTSLDPYLRLFAPKLSPYATAVADGTITVVGELTDLDHLAVNTKVEKLDMTLLDYKLANDGPIELSLEQNVARIDRLQLVGADTKLAVSGQIGLSDSTIDVQANGDANLGILQGTFKTINASGAATLRAAATGSLSNPVLSGSATIANGRIRERSMPHSLEAINGRISFDSGGIRLDDIKAKLGGGDVTLAGRIGMKGFELGELSLTATGEQMHIRYPEGFRSIIDADLSLRGTLAAPVLGGTVTVRDALYTKRFDPNTGILGLAGGAVASSPAAAAPTSTFPLRFDVQIDAPSSLRVENNLARIVSSADLRLQGTYDKPLLFGRASIDRGDLIFEGNRYLITRGTIGFANPAKIEPYFDVEAETRVRTPGEPYRVTLGFTGTFTHFTWSLNSDPPLSQVDIISLLLGQTTNLQNAELRGLNSTSITKAQEDLLKSAGARLLTGTVSAPVSRAVEQTFGIDFQIAPQLGSDTDPLTPSARITLGRRISNRAYITFTRSLGQSARDQIIVLEYDQNDRLGWVITQNSDKSFALEFRVRHVF